MVYKTTDPTTGEVVKEFASISLQEALKELRELKKNFQKWKETPVSKRVEYIKKVSELLKQNKQKYAEIVMLEVGRPIKDAVPEIEKCASLCDYYAAHAETFLEDEEIKTEAIKSYVRFEPLGTIFGIMPWNYPFWQAFRSIIPALLSGNLYAMKHAGNVPQSALAIEEVLDKAGLKDYFKLLFVEAEDVDKLIETDLIQGVSLTGSSAVGKKIGELAGKHLKKVVLELGGSDAYIVLKDADVSAACKEGLSSRFLNSGQSCNSAKRFIVVKDVADEFTNKLLEHIKSLKVGDPADKSTDMGPLATKNMLDGCERQVKDAIDKGAKVLCGGKKMGKGFYFLPTLLTNIKQNMLVANEETFAPIATVIVVNNEEEAIKEANRSIYGLGSSIWTKDLKKGEELSKKIEAGCVYVNKKVRSDPRMPFGGIKESGLGRELGEYGLKEFVNIKSIIIEK
jgi:succinate-semialdehyde dehydrogenase/glutarate-semialdehyde dehydrogenase